MRRYTILPHSKWNLKWACIKKVLISRKKLTNGSWPTLQLNQMALKKVHNAYMCLLQLLFILHARNSPSLFCLSVFILKLSTIYRCVSHGNLSTIDTVCTMWMKPQSEHSNENYRYIPNQKNMRFWVACNWDFFSYVSWYRGNNRMCDHSNDNCW